MDSDEKAPVETIDEPVRKRMRPGKQKSIEYLAYLQLNMAFT